MKLYEKNAFELHEMLKSKQCSALEIITDVNKRISETDEKIGAYITLNKNSEIQAKEVDKIISSGERINYLAGIPIGIKDNISTKGILTTCSSRMLENYIPPFNATVIDKIKNAKMIITGKTNMDEFGMGSSTETSYIKLTHNPHNLDYVPGGSSGGSAAAVAAGEAIIALGSDTGGSIRQPASYCGVVGLKPSYGSVSRFGLIAYASSLEQIGPIGKCVKDVAMLYSVICGYDRFDVTSQNIDYPDFYIGLKNNISGVRIGIPNEYFDNDIDDDVKEVVYNALKLFEKNGAKLKAISLPNTKYAINAYYIIASAEASSNLARYDGVKYGYRAAEYNGLSDMYTKTRTEGFGDEVKRRILLGTFVLSSDYYDDYYKRAKYVQNLISNEFSQAFLECDIIATPTVPSTAFKIGKKINDPIKMYSNDLCTVTANIAGLPAISIPCGYSGNTGLPYGLQLIGNKFEEQLLLNTAYSYETFCGGFDKVKKFKWEQIK